MKLVAADQGCRVGRSSFYWINPRDDYPRYQRNPPCDKQGSSDLYFGDNSRVFQRMNNCDVSITAKKKKVNATVVKQCRLQCEEILVFSTRCFHVIQPEQTEENKRQRSEVRYCQAGKDQSAWSSLDGSYVSYGQADAYVAK